MKTIHFLLLIIVFFFTSCKKQKEKIKSSNMIYEILFDSSIKGNVKEINFIGGDLVVGFKCDGNIQSMGFPSDGQQTIFEYNGDSITSNLIEKYKSLYILNEQGKVKEVQSLMDYENDWKITNKELWTYNQQGKRLEKTIINPAEEKIKYLIKRENYNYLDPHKVEIKKYGKDEATGRKNGLLRKETRYANTNGDWTNIEELDEDGIPIRTTSFSYVYDKENNWTQVILFEKDNYTNRDTRDTINRKITYYKNGDCN